MSKPDKWWKYLFPTYGNWGAPGWSGGEWVTDPARTNWDKQPVDEMDALFKEHDRGYQSGSEGISPADAQLVAGLKELNVRGAYKNAYRVCAIAAFSVKIFFKGMRLI